MYAYVFSIITGIKTLINYNYLNYYLYIYLKFFVLIVNINIMYIWFILFMLISLLNVVFYTTKKMYVKDKFISIILLYFILWYIITTLFLVEDIIIFIINFESMLFIILACSMYFIFNNRFIVALYYLIVFSIISGIFCFLLIILIFVNINISSVMLIINSIIVNNYLFILLIWGITFIIFGIKFPIYPFYFWLLAVHVEVSSEMSTILAGIILKSGFIGILKFMLILLHTINFILSNISVIFVMVGIFSCVVNLLIITDYKKIIGSWSILHVNVTLLFIWYNNNLLLLLFILSNLGHILSASSFFICVGFTYENFNNKHLFMMSSTFNFSIVNILFILLMLNNIDFPFFLLFYIELLNFFAIIFVSNYLLIILLFTIIVLFVSSLLLYFIINYYSIKWNNAFLRLDINISECNIFIIIVIYSSILFWFLSIF